MGSRLTFASAAAICIAACAGCASLPSGRPARGDPFERFNRTIFRFNTALDREVLRPLAQRTRRVPKPLSNALRNFVGNLMYPVTLVNDFLQGKLRAGFSDVARLTVNTTLGLGGLLDPATAMGLPRNEEDFGITLGKWGMPSGPFLMLPFLGPSTVRDAFGAAPEVYAYVFVPGPAIGLPLLGTYAIQGRAALLPFDALLRGAYDPYALERSIYLQERNFQVHGPAEP